MESKAPPRIFSPRRRRARLERRRGLQSRGADRAEWFLNALADDIVERIGFMQLKPERALVVGDWNGRVAEALRAGGADVTEADIDTLDEERPYPVEELDLAVSLASLDTVNDLPGALLHLHRALAPGGLLLASVPGAGSLPRLRAAIMAAEADRPAARLHPMIDSRAATGLLERAGFSRQVVDSWTLRARYGSLDRLIADLREQALGNVLRNPAPPLSRTALSRARKAFLERTGEDGKVTERFEVLTLTGWA